MEFKHDPVKQFGSARYGRGSGIEDGRALGGVVAPAEVERKGIFERLGIARHEAAGILGIVEDAVQYESADMLGIEVDVFRPDPGAVRHGEQVELFFAERLYVSDDTEGLG